ncbi:hypothetical protein [Sphingobacterium sp. MYb388]|uniref:hypothetical protein n=1 Tax=Sphingobacterium sp. MYb388 TaxID=2745437 RepID=UPI0030AC46AE
MEIVDIFAERLFAFRYAGEADNEYDRLLDLWGDMEYVYNFLKENKQDIPKHRTISQIAGYIIDDAIEIDKTLIDITETEDKLLSHFFKPLHNLESGARILSLQKGRQFCLRIYAIKIDEDTFVITGGAIKLPLQHLMEDKDHTKVELQKLNKAQDYLKEMGIYDRESFFEFLNEN